ncbi:mechanosensitive ion channel [Candidatus Woesearchaeota archaeon]|nr:mechanosensitive ion channel [Candidatus Woesearchaeota archaeon]
MAEVIIKAAEYLDIIFSQFFTKFIVAVIILLIGFVIARIVGKLVHKILHEIELNNILKKAGVKFELENPISHLTTYIVYFFTIISALNSLGLTTKIFDMLALAFLALIIISILLAIKDFVPNLISGFFIYKRGLIKVGDKIKIDNISGKVKKITLIETEIETSAKDIIHIPNSTITKKEILVKKKK